VKIYFDGDERDNYNRILGYIEVDDKDYNEELLKKGYAQLRYLFRDKYKRLDKYRDAEAYANQNKLNIWSLKDYTTPGIDDGWNYTSR
jgi:micrococcal nuclease